MTTEARTPTRIDLAGGTLDLHPIYLFEDGGLTVNMAIDVYSDVSVDNLPDGRVVLESVDLGQKVAADSVEVALGGPLDLLVRAVRFYAPNGGVHVRTRNAAPKGSGLGASSSLLMALSGALDRAAAQRGTPEDYIHWGANIEAQNLRIPTGKQDYYAAIYGGILGIDFGVEGSKAHAVAVPAGFTETMEKHLVLCFTGLSHFSGANNWAMIKRYIDATDDTVARMRAIKQTAYDMQRALEAGDIGAVATVLAREWENRRGLAEGVTTPQIDAMMEAAEKAGAYASKLCGAGGGGCMVTICEDGTQDAVKQALESHGARIIPFKIDRAGLQVN